MENESSIKEIIRNALEEVRSVMDADTIVGQPVKLDNGATIIPISKVSMGFASGGLDLPNKAEAGGKKNFGGGGGTGVSVIPIGFLTAFPDGRVELLPLKPEQSTAIEQVADIINRTPEIIGKIKDLFGKKPSEQKEAEKPEEPKAEEKKESAVPAPAPAPAAKEGSDTNLTEKMLTNISQDETYAPADTSDEDDIAPVEKRLSKEEKSAQKAARKKEAADLKKAKREAARRKASFDYADED